MVGTTFDAGFDAYFLRQRMLEGIGENFLHYSGYIQTSGGAWQPHTFQITNLPISLNARRRKCVRKAAAQVDKDER